MKKAAYLILFLSFLLCYHITTPEYIGDTVRYAGDVIGHQQSYDTQFWEFGHLLWRPWGYIGHSLFGTRYAQTFGDTPAQSVARFLIWTNFICSAVALLLLLSLARKVARVWVAMAVVFTLSCSNSFLNYSHSGAPYIPALLFSTLTLLLLTTAGEYPEKGQRYALLAGLSFAITCALWFPYSFTGLGMLMALYVCPLRDSRAMREESSLRLQLIGSFLFSLAAGTLILFAYGAAAKHIGNVTQLSQWIRESDNGWSQSKNAMRAITGLPRSVWDLGDDTIFLKRWLFSDPYNPAHISTLIFSLGGKLAAFYLCICATVLVLWKERRTLLVMVVAAGLPLLVFAIAVFEPSSPERFLPLFPFAYVAFAAVLDSARRYVVPSACIVILLIGTTVCNLLGNRNVAAGARLDETRARIHALDDNVQSGALVAVVTFNDDLYDLPAAHPLDKSLASSRFHVTDVVVLASRTTAQWRTAFAEQTQKQWARQAEVWFSERLLAPKPEARWRWVEGDDIRVHWPELPTFFGQLETDLKAPSSSDGFLRVAQNQANRNRLAKWLAAEVKLTP